jgi:Repeat of unknown function (DUF5650)
MTTNRRLALLFLFVPMCLFTTIGAAQKRDIHGPPGSYDFGYGVTALPNGNFVVTAPYTGAGGTVYLYSSAGVLISTLTGSEDNDAVGNGGVIVLKNGNYVIVSPDWAYQGATYAGAATWGSATTGVSGVVSASNSIVGTSAQDSPLLGVFALANGNYVVDSPAWNDSGAVTWGDGTRGTSGVISATSSLVATEGGFVFTLENGNYVVANPYWNNTVGSVTWGNGGGGTTGPLSVTNSLTGSQPGDYVGNSITALTNGNYVIASPSWNGNSGAVTWANGAAEIVGEVTPSNSLIGNANDYIGEEGVTALTNGNYVVTSPSWNGNFGAVTWGNGATGLVGQVSASNSLVGDGQYPELNQSVLALANGNYVALSPRWHGRSGAATWGNGGVGTMGVISESNSLVGRDETEDSVGAGGAALANGNYVVTSFWNQMGAATWGNGSSGITGQISQANSLIGTDGIGDATALKNGNYVVVGGSDSTGGGVAWGDGAIGTTGTFSASNSFTGSQTDDDVADPGITALSDGNYAIASRYWNGSLGAVTWGNGASGSAGVISGSNSLVGSTSGDDVGYYGATAVPGGGYIVYSDKFQNGSLTNAGAVTFVHGGGPYSGVVDNSNSVIGQIANPGYDMSFDYDPEHLVLIVGRPSENIVTLFNVDVIFASGFE